MNKQEAVPGFLNSLKVALNNSSVYFQEHPVLKKSVEDFKVKTDLLLEFVSSIKIGFAPASLFINGEVFEKTRLYEELAGFFHFRKIRSVEIKKGVSLEELINFLQKISMPPREIFKKGVLESILKRDNASHVLLEILDYSQFLHSEDGEEDKDVWIYLFGSIVSEDDARNINQLVDNFEKIISKFKSNELLEDEELHSNIVKFLAYLQNKEQEKFLKCSKEVIKLLLKNKKSSQEDMHERARIFFKGLDVQELADTLWQEIIGDDNFNVFSFNLFSTLVKDKKQDEHIASSLAYKFRKDKQLNASPRMRNKIKELVSSSDVSLPEVYQRTLSKLLKEMVDLPAGQKKLEAAALHASYRFLILNLLVGEKSRSRLVLISEKFLAEWYAVIADNDIRFLKAFLEIAEKKMQDISFADIFSPFRKRALGFIENLVLEDEGLPEAEYFSNMLTESSLHVGYYLDKIFKENKVNPFLLKLFFRFFPGSLPIFRDNLKKKSTDADFLKNIVDSLKIVNSAASLQLLEYIYSFTHVLLKIEIVKAMREMNVRDEIFLFSILKGAEMPLKKEVFPLIKNDPRNVKNALEILLGIPSPLGIRNKILLENIEIAAEDGGGKETVDFLLMLSQKRFFWNRAVREKAKEALMRLHAEKF